MPISEARLAANRRNAARSTGPKTAEGKAASRANALKHGLCASTIVPEDAQAVQERAREYFRTLKPQNSLHCWVVSQISLLSLRVDRSQRIERRVRDKVAIKAETTWDEDRRAEAALLGKTLGNLPEVIVDQLRKTPHGCDWLIGRWALLAHAADLKQGAWTPAQEELAFDLLGTPPEFREGVKPGARLDRKGRVIGPAEAPADLARRQIDELEVRREEAAILDEANRALAAADLNDDQDAELKRTRRHEATLQRRVRWFMKQLQVQSPFAEPLRGLETVWLGQQEVPTYVLPPNPNPLPTSILPPTPPRPPEPIITAGRFPDLHPPFDLEPDEIPPPGQKPDIPQILLARREKQLRKAEARREARRRKLEDLRA